MRKNTSTPKGENAPRTESARQTKSVSRKPEFKTDKKSNDSKGPRDGKSKPKPEFKGPASKRTGSKPTTAPKKYFRSKPEDKPKKGATLHDETEQVSLNKIVHSKGSEIKSRGKRKEYTSKVQSTVNPPEYDFKKINDIAKYKGKSKKTDEIRLNRYIANAGVCSRRDADMLIQMGEIKVNGKIVTELGYKVNLDDEIRCGNKLLSREKKVYVLLNKPKDFITTTDDPQERKTVMQLVANAGKERIYPVGRLDRNTTGLLLLTNDGELSEKLAHPSNKIQKIYMVELDKPITNEDFEKIQKGLHLEDGFAPVDDLALVGNTRRFLGIEIHLGRNRIVRRIFEHLGYEVKALDRVMYASLTKKDLPRGTWRYLTEKEVINLKYYK